MLTQRQAKATLTNIKKHLLSCGCEFDHNSERSNSIYVKICEHKIRISDHISPINANSINVLLSLNAKYTVTINGGLLIYDKISELKSFLKTWCEMQIINNTTNLNIINGEISNKKSKLANLGNELGSIHIKIQKANAELLSIEKKLGNVSDLVFNEDASAILEELTDKQKNHLIEIIKHYKKQNKQSKKKKTNSSPQNIVSVSSQSQPPISDESCSTPAQDQSKHNS